MKLQSAKSRKPQGFTLIEMIGVLAVIAILAALLIPKVFNAISSARINNASVSIETIKTATADHYGKYGSLTALWGTNNLPLSISDYCSQVLIPEALIDKPFAVKIGTNAVIQVVAPQSSSGSGGWYSLDGSGSNSVAGATAIVEAVISGVAAQDAKDLNDQVDGVTPLGVPDLVSADTKGRVEYAAPSGGLTTVYVYISSR